MPSHDNTLCPCLLGTLWMLSGTASAYAQQDDVALVDQVSEGLLAQDASDETRWLAATHTTGDLAQYPVGGTYHRWHGMLDVDIAMARFGRERMWRMGLSMQTVADYRNEIRFRLVRLYYEATAAFEQRLGRGILALAYRHQCTHGADAAVRGRILIRSGPELSLQFVHDLGALVLTTRSAVQATLIGQNVDTNAQPRVLASMASRALWPRPGWAPFIALGLGSALVGTGNGDVYVLWHPLRTGVVRWLPSAALGVRIDGHAARLRLMLHYQRLLDTGFTSQRTSADLLALRVGFLW